MQAYLDRLLAVFGEVHRILREDGVAVVNLADSYANDEKWGGRTGGKHVTALHGASIGRSKRATGIRAKSLMLIPQRFAIAMQDQGWIVRNVCAWVKPSCMPSSAQDRFTASWEPVYLFSKQPRYYFDITSILEPAVSVDTRNGRVGAYQNRALDGTGDGTTPTGQAQRAMSTRQPRDVLVCSSGGGYDGEHYAAYPEALVERFVLAGTPAAGCCEQCGTPWQRMITRAWELNTRTGKNAMKGPGHFRTTPGGPANRPGREWLRVKSSITKGWEPGCRCDADTVPSVVLDPFCGSGTTGAVAIRHGRHFIGVDLHASYIALARQRIQQAWYETVAGTEHRAEKPLEGQLDMFAPEAANG